MDLPNLDHQPTVKAECDSWIENSGSRTRSVTHGHLLATVLVVIGVGFGGTVV